MTSLHVICGLGPQIKNPGYAYVPEQQQKMQHKTNTYILFSAF